MKTRREFLGGAARVGVGAAVVVGCGGRVVRAPVGPVVGGMGFEGADSLKAHAAARGFLYGCAVDVGLLKADAGYAELVAGQANIVVAENAMKWGALRPGVDRFEFGEADEFVGFAEKHGMKVRGHNLCWHRQLPGWFSGVATKENAKGLLVAHIERVVGRYAGRMHSWDVVNEAVEVKDGRGDGLRESPWLKLMGPEYVEVAFQTARDADPQALLTYNDYGIEGEDAASEAKRGAVLVLLRRLKARHVPVDAVGVQSHVRVGGVYGKGLQGFMAAVRDMGLQVFVTELDVNDRLAPADVGLRDKAVAEVYGRYVDLMMAEPGVRAVLTWGITDRRTWLNGEDSRTDKLPERCLPFGPEDEPMEAFFAMRKSFDGRRVKSMV